LKFETASAPQYLIGSSIAHISEFLNQMENTLRNYRGFPSSRPWKFWIFGCQGLQQDILY